MRFLVKVKDGCVWGRFLGSGAESPSNRSLFRCVVSEPVGRTVANELPSVVFDIGTISDRLVAFFLSDRNPGRRHRTSIFIGHALTITTVIPRHVCESSCAREEVPITCITQTTGYMFYM